jgi:curli production assembly/transport component CsgG
MVVVKYLLTAILLLQGCAAVPKWSELPQNCNPNMWGPEYNHDVWNYAKASGRIFTKAMPYICVENPEVVRMPSYIELLEIPPAKEMPVVAVYQFTDKTGQRKARPGIADFSTAVTQGGVEMVVDALKTAGQNSWFRVVERNGIDHLVRERQIIRSARQDVAKKQGQEKYKELNPLLFAGIIIEGGIIGYDTDIKSGGRGARTLGVGVSRQYRQDVVTISMRAISVLTGEVLLNVQTRKTVFSYGTGGDVFKYIEEGTQLVEFEDGLGNNESVTYAVRTAIEAGVLELIYQGHRRGYWEIEGYNENE